MSLRRRLERLRDTNPQPKPPTPAPSVDARLDTLRRELGRMEKRDQRKTKARASARAETLAIDAPGSALDASPTSPRLVTSRHAPSHRHGNAPIGEAPTLAAKSIARLALDPELAGIDVARALYLDTETTGLAGGTGTLPFLVGVGFFEPPGDLVVEQLVVPEPGREAPMLRHLAARIEAASCLVTYNGKSFDWPLLRTRFVLNRVKLPAPKPHLDLLHAARRVYRRRLGAVRLGHIEREVLGFVREGDIDGAEIPTRYFDFLRGGDWTLLTPIIEHNRLDIVALAALLARLVGQYEGEDPTADGRDRLGLAETAQRARDLERAEALADAASRESGGEDATTALRLLATLHRRAGAPERAASVLERALAEAPSTQHPEIHLALAKLYEHRLRRLTDALTHAAAAVGAEPPDASARRITRLTRKLETARDP